MVDLTMARSRGVERVPLTALAQAQKIPAGFLEQILLRLRQGGFLHSTRGKKGGYSLAYPPEGIRLGELTRFLEGPLTLLPCGVPGGESQCSCPDVERCGVRVLMRQAAGALCGVLDGCTLAELAGQTLDAYERDQMTPAILSAVLGAVSKEQAKERAAQNGSEPEYWI